MNAVTRPLYRTLTEDREDAALWREHVGAIRGRGTAWLLLILAAAAVLLVAVDDSTLLPLLQMLAGRAR